MKKSFLAIFICVVIALVLWLVTTIYFPNIQDISASEDDITLSLNSSSINLKQPVLQINIENNSKDQVTYGSKWLIDKFVKGEWKQVFPIGETAFTTELYTVEPHSSNTEKVHLEAKHI